MQTFTRDDFDRLLESDRRDYYIGRWDYYKEVITLVNEIKPESVLELGPGKHTIVHDCDIMINPKADAFGRPENSIAQTILHDATDKPWPVKDKQYDLFIALQVWEHLNNKQSRAFREVLRVARRVILSFPYLWDCPLQPGQRSDHHMIDEELIGDWTLQMEPTKIIKIPAGGDKMGQQAKIIYYWELDG